MASKVFFTDFRTAHNQSLAEKLKKLIRQAGIDSIDFEGKFVAIKMHFGEPEPWWMWSRNWEESPS